MPEEFVDILVALSLKVEDTSQHDVMSCVDLAGRFSRPSTVLDKRDVERLTRVAKVQRAFLQERARRWLAQRHDRPILVQYGSGLTPLMTRERVSRECKGCSVVRSGKACAQQFWLKRYVHTICCAKPTFASSLIAASGSIVFSTCERDCQTCILLGTRTAG